MSKIILDMVKNKIELHSILEGPNGEDLMATLGPNKKIREGNEIWVFPVRRSKGEYKVDGPMTKVNPNSCKVCKTLQ